MKSEMPKRSTGIRFDLSASYFTCRKMGIKREISLKINLYIGPKGLFPVEISHDVFQNGLS